MFKNKKILITGAINKFDGQTFTFNFHNNKRSPCLRCFFQTYPSDQLLNCDIDESWVHWLELLEASKQMRLLRKY